jgi:queuine tRNA-ribosyltransferase
MADFSYRVVAEDPDTNARAGVLTTPHGEIETPIFMPVGTAATVKTMKPRELEEIGAQIILANTYHLFLRPGADLVQKMGGLHGFSRWSGPMLTDSGGFQVFSQSNLRKITEKGVQFRSYIDGSKHFMGPEESIAVQEALGADIIMAFDECTALPAERKQVLASMDRTTRWLKRCIDAKTRDDQALFGIIQGGVEEDLRKQHLEQLLPFDLPGYAIGGLSVGEPPAEMYRITEAIAPLMPADKPRYLMGVGRPQDLVESVSHGVDMFDCVMPSRNARNAHLFTKYGAMRIRNARYKDDPKAIDENTNCYASQNFSRAYLRHLFYAKEMLGPILATMHNLAYYLQLSREMRQAIIEGRFAAWRREFYTNQERGIE